MYVGKSIKQVSFIEEAVGKNGVLYIYDACKGLVDFLSWRGAVIVLLYPAKFFSSAAKANQSINNISANQKTRGGGG